MIDQLFPLQPPEGTLAWLIFEAVRAFGNKRYVGIADGNLSYHKLDCLSDDLAAYFINQDVPKNNVLYIQFDSTENPFIVLLAAVKAGVMIIEGSDTRAHKSAGQIFNKNILTFANGIFINCNHKISFWDAMNIGAGYPFFNIPDVCKDDIVFFITSPGLVQQTIDHKAVLEMISKTPPPLGLIPVIAFFHSLKNNVHFDGSGIRLASAVK